ncbi:AraC family transcriptional regulator [Pseudomaricurvus sp. HS19]|uniref:AraC family transcriptional regulator n=1 Tax=Pseudomaricurvus sp. HS19 TaxID=2692626 RepID=UPI001369CC5C|nr:AraC family transcriptional regulator [Pseudomaricurvus sp. HS19]MYM64910.1 helix-turn-helix domain-containing protein [Pseudomaricurvus sp. HS19]
MEQITEQIVATPRVSVLVHTVSWDGVEDTPAYRGYNLSQRLSDNHSPLRIGKLSTPEVMPRVHAVGLLPPGLPIRLYPMEQPLRVLNCIYDEDYFEATTQIPAEQWEKYTNALVFMRNQRLETLMQEIHAEIEQPGFGSEILIESVSNMILVELARYMRQLQRKGNRGRDGVGLAPWQLRRVQERIESSPQEGYPSLAQLAALCNISEGHLARAFKAATGWQIHKYITAERLKTAKALLSNDHYSCEEVACQLGFKSAAYFSTAFRRLTGKTPTEFRRQARDCGQGKIR